MAFCSEILILGKKGFTIHGQSQRGVLSGYVFVEVSTKYYLGSMHQWGWLKFHLFDSQGAKLIGDWCISGPESGLDFFGGGFSRSNSLIGTPLVILMTLTGYIMIGLCLD